MIVTLYPRDRQILEFVSQFIQRNGYAPTLREIGNAVGLSSVATIHEHLETLRQKGFIKKLDGTTRGISVIEGTIRTGSQEGPVELPVLGYIAAGSPLEPYTDPNSYLSVSPTLIARDKPAYVLQVRGESMKDDGILDGDYVVVQHQKDASNGDIVVALLPNGLSTLKRIFFEKTRIRLEPANAAMSPIFTTHVKVQGRVVGVIRKYN